jgi:lipopolysaccharide transport system ATP-binding protein
MSNTVIRVENLGKKYIIGHQKQERYTSLRDVITDKVRSFGQVLQQIGISHVMYANHQNLV